MTGSWKVDVVADASGAWLETTERFVTEADAANAAEWWGELTRIREVDITESRDPATHVCRGWDVFGRALAPERIEVAA